MWSKEVKRLRYVLLVLCWLTLGAGGNMSPMQDEKVERFKKKVDFDVAVRRENPAEAVNVVWPEILKAPGLESGQWTVAADSTWRAKGGVVRKWVLRRGPEQIAVVIFVSLEGPRPPQDFLLSRATENMMVDSPFVKGPTALGTLAVSMPPEAEPNLIWVFRNVCFDVRGIDSHIDVNRIALWLQSAAERGVVKSEKARLRMPGALHVSTHKAPLGTPVDIRLQPAAPADEARYMINLEFDRRVIEVMSQDRLAAQIRGRVAGGATLDVHVIDMATLLMAHSRIELEFLPAT